MTMPAHEGSGLSILFTAVSLVSPKILDTWWVLHNQTLKERFVEWSFTE